MGGRVKYVAGRGEWVEKKLEENAGKPENLL